MLSQMSTELYLGNFIFDFASRYYWANPGIKNLSDFKFTAKDFEDFGNFLREKYIELLKALITELEKDIAHDLDQDLAIFRDEITQLLEEEIIGRYFYEEGTIVWSVDKDVQIQKALEILNDKAWYNSILSGKNLPVLRANEPPASYARFPGQLSAERPASRHSTFHI